MKRIGTTSKALVIIGRSSTSVANKRCAPTSSRHLNGAARICSLSCIRNLNSDLCPRPVNKDSEANLVSGNVVQSPTKPQIKIPGRGPVCFSAAFIRAMSPMFVIPLISPASNERMTVRRDDAIKKKRSFINQHPDGVWSIRQTALPRKWQLHVDRVSTGSGNDLVKPWKSRIVRKSRMPITDQVATAPVLTRSKIDFGLLR